MKDLKIKNTEKIFFPKIIWEEAETIEDLEDWFFANNKDFIKKMRQARAEDLTNKGLSLKEIKKKYVWSNIYTYGWRWF